MKKSKLWLIIYQPISLINLTKFLLVKNFLQIGTEFCCINILFHTCLAGLTSHGEIEAGLSISAQATEFLRTKFNSTLKMISPGKQDLFMAKMNIGSCEAAD